MRQSIEYPFNLFCSRENRGRKVKNFGEIKRAVREEFNVSSGYVEACSVQELLELFFNRGWEWIPQ